MISKDHPYNQFPVPANFPEPFKPIWFQKQLDKIGGKELNGKSRFVLRWGQSSEAQDWDPWGREWRARYIHRSFKQKMVRSETESGIVDIKMETFDVAIPRWFVEYYIPPGVACLGHQVTGVDSEGDSWFDPLPTGGLYEPMLEISEHDGNCCADMQKQNLACHGFYRDPSEEDLQMIRFLIWKRDHQKEERPGAERNLQTDLETSRKKESEWRSEWLKGLEERIGGITKDAVKTHGFTLQTDDPTVLKWGKWHWTHGHSKSGLTNKTVYGEGENGTSG